MWEMFLHNVLWRRGYGSSGAGGLWVYCVSFSEPLEASLFFTFLSVSGSHWEVKLPLLSHFYDFFAKLLVLARSPICRNGDDPDSDSTVDISNIASFPGARDTCCPQALCYRISRRCKKWFLLKDLVFSEERENKWHNQKTNIFQTKGENKCWRFSNSLQFEH